jgi:hypothetical protein
MSELKFPGEPKRPRSRVPVGVAAVIVSMLGVLILAWAGTGSDAEDRLSVAGPGDPIVCDPLAPDRPSCIREPDPTSTTVGTTLPVPETTIPETTTPDAPLATLVGNDGPLRLTVDIDSPTTVAGTVVRFDVHAKEPGGRSRAIGVNFGDGGAYGLPVAPIPHCIDDDSTSTTSTTSPPDEEGTDLYEHAYRLPGRYNVRFVVASSACDSPPRRVEVRGTIVVGPGVLLSNGPLLPVIVDASQMSSENPSTGAVELNVHVRDLDGFISAVTVKWGDTTETTKTYPQTGCTDPTSRWPGPTSDSFVERHLYASPGAHEVTVTVVSIGCTGADRQISEKTISVVPGS